MWGCDPRSYQICGHHLQAVPYCGRHLQAIPYLPSFTCGSFRHPSRHGTISNFRSISISKFSETWFSKSISISKFFKKFIQYQNQYQYQNFSILNIKINIKIFQSPKSISISISKLSKYWYWYWKSKIFGPKSLLFNLLLLLCHLRHHQIPIEPQLESLALALNHLFSAKRISLPN